MEPFLGVPNPGQQPARGPDPVSLSQRNPPGSHSAVFLSVYVRLRYLNTRNRAVPSHLPQRSPQDGLSARGRTDPDPIPAGPSSPAGTGEGLGQGTGLLREMETSLPCAELRTPPAAQNAFSYSRE